jgi:ectoine hydroxylase-related dioxygenase (phytanoyl-CoA dioxygenase family)
MPNTVLSDEQIADFRRDGFLVVRGMIGAEEMRDIAAWTDEVENWPEVPGAHMMYFEQSLKGDGRRILNRLENFYPYHEGFQRLFDSQALKGAVSDLFGEDAVLYKEKINFKLPGGDGFKLHQDQQAGWSTYADYFITALVSIDEATEENGCLELAPGLHDRGLIGSEWKPMTEDDLDGRALVSCPTQPGDVVFFDSYCPHGSGPNLSDNKRRVLYITYNRASAGDHRVQYYVDKRKSYPPDIEREPDKEYVFRV